LSGTGGLGANVFNILRAIGEAPGPVPSIDIAEATGISQKSVAQYIRWHMLHKWVRVAYKEKKYNGKPMKYYTLTNLGKTKLEAIT